jgi:hypothetical protein
MANLKEALEQQGYIHLKRRLILSVIILITAIIIVIIAYLFFIPKSCNDMNCFSNSLQKCSRTYFIKEDLTGSWYYEILGSNGKDSCNVKIKLLKMNTGTIDTESLQGNEMKCIVSKGETLAPEDNMNVCSGPLKEKLQEIIIDRMHSYISKNIGEVKESFAP